MIDRNARGRYAEHMKTLAEWKQHAPDGAYTFFGLFNGILSLSRYGETLTLTVTDDSINRLREIQQMLHRAYLPVRK